ncbi:MAG: hypothetical protein HQL87_00645 [Magnetococcales bacterium]|nr:hypothetical protein [Magnetococcales bacterium]
MGEEWMTSNRKSTDGDLNQAERMDDDAEEEEDEEGTDATLVMPKDIMDEIASVHFTPDKETKST